MRIPLPRIPFRHLPGGDRLWRTLGRPQPHRVVRYRIGAPHWPAAEPLTVTVLTDLHTGSTPGDLARMERIVADADALGSDLVLLGGDYVNMSGFGERVPPQTTARILARLRAPLGRFAVLGNHDWKFGYDAVAGALREVGFAVLENESRALPLGDTTMRIVGLSDEVRGRPDPDRAFAGIGDEPVLVLAHDPASLLRVRGRRLVMVSGHTHAGQYAFPGIGPLVNMSRAPRAWTHGLVTEGESALVVGAGLGMSLLPLRNIPGEILRLELGPGPTEAA